MFTKNARDVGGADGVRRRGDAGRRGLTSRGSRPEAFGPAEWGLLATVSVVWGSSFLFIAIGLDAFRPAVVALVRLALGAATLAFFASARSPIARDDWGRVTALAVLWMALPLVLFPTAQQWISSGLAGMINGALPLFSASFAALFLRKLPHRSQVIGLLVGFLGVVAVVWPAAQGTRADLLGIVLAIVAVISYGIALNLAVPLQQRYGALPVLLRAQIIATAMVTPVAALQLEGSGWAWASALAMLPLGILGTGLAFVCMTTLAGRAGAARGAVAIYFLPVVAVILGVIFRDERVAAVSLGGMVLVLLGAWLTSRKEG